MKECPFNEQSFVQKIQLGRSTVEREFLDEIMETVISDMKAPLTPSRIQATKTWNYGCLFLSALILFTNTILAVNFSFGVGEIDFLYTFKCFIFQLMMK